jgi:hypothetical protein
MDSSELTLEELRALHDIHRYKLSFHIARPVREKLEKDGLIEFSFHQAWYVLTERAIEMLKEKEQ